MGEEGFLKGKSGGKATWPCHMEGGGPGRANCLKGGNNTLRDQEQKNKTDLTIICIIGINYISWGERVQNQFLGGCHEEGEKRRKTERALTSKREVNREPQKDWVETMKKGAGGGLERMGNIWEGWMLTNGQGCICISVASLGTEPVDNKLRAFCGGGFY